MICKDGTKPEKNHWGHQSQQASKYKRSNIVSYQWCIEMRTKSLVKNELLQTLHLWNYSVHNTPRVTRSTPSWGKWIKFIEKDDTWTCWSSLPHTQDHTLLHTSILELRYKTLQPLTFWNMSRTFFSDSPMYILINSGPFTLRKFREHSVATAFANRV